MLACPFCGNVSGVGNDDGVVPAPAVYLAGHVRPLFLPPAHELCVAGGVRVGADRQNQRRSTVRVVLVFVSSEKRRGW